MAWACPVCETVNDSDSMIKCICGHEIKAEDVKQFAVELPVPDVVYAGFLRRFIAIWIDVLVLAPVLGLFLYIEGLDRNLSLFIVIPSTLIFWGYNFYCHGRSGATIGKWAMNVRVVKTDLTPMGYKESFLRFSPDALFAIFLIISQESALLNISIEEFASLGFVDRMNRLDALAPAWNNIVDIFQQIWIWSEFIVLLLNKKRRALHDYIAGTVVILTEEEFEK
jgi:uncharacterized RDD family membrane protein YckC